MFLLHFLIIRLTHSPFSILCSVVILLGICAVFLAGFRPTRSRPRPHTPFLPLSFATMMRSVSMSFFTWRFDYPFIYPYGTIDYSFPRETIHSAVQFSDLLLIRFFSSFEHSASVTYPKTLENIAAALTTTHRDKSSRNRMLRVPPL